MRKDNINQVEANSMNQTSADFLQVYKTLAFDLPLASVRWAFGIASDKETTTTLWKGYDASIRLATATVDSIYRTQSLSEIFGTTANQMLRLQRLNNAANGFFATSLFQPQTQSVTSNTSPTAAQQSASEAQPSKTTPARTKRPAGARSQTKKIHIQAPVLAPVSPLPQQSNLQVAA